MFDGATGLLISYIVQPWGLDGNADLALNDQPLPVVVSSSYPMISGNQWLTGSVITLTFGALNQQDINRLVGVNGKIVTFSVAPLTEWTRCTGSAVYNATSRTLTITLTKPVFLNPFQVMNPFL